VSGNPLAAGRAQDRKVRQPKTDVLPLSQRHQLITPAPTVVVSCLCIW